MRLAQLLVRRRKFYTKPGDRCNWCLQSRKPCSQPYSLTPFIEKDGVLVPRPGNVGCANFPRTCCTGPSPCVIRCKDSYKEAACTHPFMDVMTTDEAKRIGLMQDRDPESVAARKAAGTFKNQSGSRRNEPDYGEERGGG